ncbi:hypothetical protein GSY69_09695 [Brevibacterium sp. 5221]|uniref:Uncharacterized protein n=1 Tax=Brevibacterium rongguiense TaxID=2695267 RepID=A0A6N9H8D2_9MICO|nr:hypothetical protein [Brevibacterium rongguiense]MYM20229.1 hypothetical protein [Brevibacterium rongguiense]
MFDLTALAYVFRTTLAVILTPPAGAVTLTGVPESYMPEEVQAWIAGTVKLTPEDLVRYWREQRLHAINAKHCTEEMMGSYDRGQVGVTSREVYRERYDTQTAREVHTTGATPATGPQSLPVHRIGQHHNERRADGMTGPDTPPSGAVGAPEGVKKQRCSRSRHQVSWATA